MHTTTLIPIDSGDEDVKYAVLTPNNDNIHEPIYSTQTANVAATIPLASPLVTRMI